MGITALKTQTKFQNLFYYIAGLGFLCLAKVRNTLQGYSRLKPFPISEYDRCIAYDLRIVDHWFSFLKSYVNQDNFFVGKNVLELGPGSDLGIGLYLLAKGVARYNALDVNNLIKNVPYRFYELLFARLKEVDSSTDVEFLREQLDLTQQFRSDRLNYACREDFNILSAFGQESMDIVFSQAAFEHFEDIDKVVQQLSLAVKPGAVIVTEIDFRTHSRWICDKDPNNIYRYPKRLYRLFFYRGVPNRKRPFEYVEALRKYGWSNIVVIPLQTLSEYEFRED